MIQFRFISLVVLLMAFGTGSAIIGAQDAVVKIGLLIPDPEASAAKHGAELAIREANEKGGYSGHPFHLVVRSTEGPWGAGSKESVSLVFEDEVVAIMGSLDGRNAHLAEQVATKTRILFLSSWATDMTLSRAFVPWYFRCIPNDDQQATSLIQEIYKRRKMTNVAIIGTDDYDSMNAVHTFVKTAASMNAATPKQFLYRLSGKNFQMVLKEINQSDIEAIVLFGKPALASDILPMLQQRNMNHTIFGSLSIMDDQKASDPDWAIFEEMNLVSSGHWFTEKGIAFQKSFQRAFGYQPGAAAAYAYDGMNVVIEVISKSGPDHDKIIDAFAETNYKTGVTGEIQFDANGNRMGISGLMTIKNGKPVVISADE
ncbi:MAG: ABC transporter substrate-binding protein [Bacteroidales bacterium]|nr:ABC transporter substrate-binding protein [Bacteroidales bacterium]